MERIQKLANSPQAKKLGSRAQEIAKDPRTKQKLEEVRGRVMNKGRRPPAPTTGTPPATASEPGPEPAPPPSAGGDAHATGPGQAPPPGPSQ